MVWLRYHIPGIGWAKPITLEPKVEDLGCMNYGIFGQYGNCVIMSKVIWPFLGRLKIETFGTYYKHKLLKNCQNSIENNCPIWLTS